jgi:hypothetical protein
MRSLYLFAGALAALSFTAFSSAAAQQSGPVQPEGLEPFPLFGSPVRSPRAPRSIQPSQSFLTASITPTTAAAKPARFSNMPPVSTVTTAT